MCTGHLQHRAVWCYEHAAKVEDLFNRDCAVAKHKECIDITLPRKVVLHTSHACAHHCCIFNNLAHIHLFVRRHRICRDAADAVFVQQGGQEL